MKIRRAILIACLALLSANRQAGANDREPANLATIHFAASQVRIPSTSATAATPRSEERSHAETLAATPKMSWRTLKVGAGGFITGIDIAGDGTKVIRTDVYGAYVYDTSSNLWRQMVTVDSVPYPNAEVGSGQGVYEIAIAPSNSHRFYMIFDGYLFRSDDRGLRWIRTALKQEIAANPNDRYRGFGRKMAVDPENADVVYAGLPSGLFVTTDGGTSWSKVDGVATSSVASGGVIVAFDPSSKLSGGRTQGIYVSSYGHGVFHSTDAGAIWTLTDGTPTTHMHMFADAKGIVWLVEDTNGNEGAGDLYRYMRGAWSKVSPVRLAQSVTVNPLNADHIFVLDFDGKLMISPDSGSTWIGPTNIYSDVSDIPWIGATNTSLFSSVDIKFDPSTSNRLYVASGIGVFYTAAPSVLAKGITWTSENTGVEELVSTWIISPPGGNPILTAWDRPVFLVADPDTYPLGHGVNYDYEIVRGASADWASSSPNTIVVIANNFAPTASAAVDTSGYSLDGGRTWKLFRSNSPYSTNKTAGGCIAASTPKDLLWVPTDGAGDNSPWYTTDGGEHWQTSKIPGVPTSGTTGWGFIFYLNRQICAADRITPNAFYLYNDGSGSRLAAGVYRSVDGGATWTHAYSHAFPNSGYSAQMRSVPGQAGHLFFTSGSQSKPHPSRNEFYRSTDGGTTWRAVNGVREVQSFGFGKPAPGESYPSIYIAGWVLHDNYQFGIWRSTDGGSTWTQVGDGFPGGSLSPIEAVEGDNNIFGTVYVGTTGNGWYYGKLN